MTLDERYQEIEKLKEEIQQLTWKIPNTLLHKPAVEREELQIEITHKKKILIFKQDQLITQQKRIIAFQKRWLQGAK